MSEHSLSLLFRPRQCLVSGRENPRHQQRAVPEHPNFAAQWHEPDIAGRNLALAVKRPDTAVACCPAKTHSNAAEIAVGCHHPISGSRHPMKRILSALTFALAIVLALKLWLRATAARTRHRPHRQMSQRHPHPRRLRPHQVTSRNCQANQTRCRHHGQRQRPLLLPTLQPSTVP